MWPKQIGVNRKNPLPVFEKKRSIKIKRKLISHSLLFSYSNKILKISCGNLCRRIGAPFDFLTTHLSTISIKSN